MSENELLFVMFFFLINKLGKVQKNKVMHKKAYECIARLVGRFSGKISATWKESMMYRSGLKRQGLMRGLMGGQSDRRI